MKADRKRLYDLAVVQWVLGERVGKSRVSLELDCHLIFHCFKKVLWLAVRTVVVSHGCDQATQVMGMPVCPVGGDDGTNGNLQFFKLASCTWVVQLKAEVGAIHRVQSAIGELIDLLAFAKEGAFCKVVGGNDCLVEVGVKVL